MEKVVKRLIELKKTISTMESCTGGGVANAEGSEIYDWYFISVTEGVVINIDANNYDNFNILG